jgi:uncharacterized membrane protein
MREEVGEVGVGGDVDACEDVGEVLEYPLLEPAWSTRSAA